MTSNVYCRTCADFILSENWVDHVCPTPSDCAGLAPDSRRAEPLIFESTRIGPPSTFEKFKARPAELDPNQPWAVNDKSAGTIRGAMLDEAKRLTEGDRNATHGDPIPNMELFDYLAKPIYQAERMPPAVKGALINVVHKLARLIYNHSHRDSYCDLAAYAAIAGEAAQRSNHAEQ